MALRIVALLFAASTTASVACAEPPRALGALYISPVMNGISIETPDYDRADELKLTRVEKEQATGWQLATANGRVLRRFLDTNGDKRIDRWVFFRDGREVYRDIDTDYNGLADVATKKFYLMKNEADKLVPVGNER